MGNNLKVKANKVLHATVLDSKGKSHRLQIETVVQNAANRQFARRNVITKGAIIQGMVNGKSEQARVTNRPGQVGQVTGILLEKPVDNEEKKEKKPKIEAKTEEKHAKKAKTAKKAEK